MPTNICCTQFIENVCKHPAAPSRFARATECIVFMPGNDPRLDYTNCKIRIPYPKPQPPPKAP